MGYRRLDSSFWADSFHHELEQGDAQRLQVLLTFLILGPLSTSVPGLINAGLATLAEKLRWPIEEVLATMMLAGLDVVGGVPEAHREAFGRATGRVQGRPTRKASGKALFRAHFSAQVVWIESGPAWAGKPESPNVVKGWARHVGEVPDCEVKKEALRRLFEWVSDPDVFRSRAFREAFLKAFRKGLPESLPKAFADRDRDRDQRSREEEISKAADVPRPPAKAPLPPPSPGGSERPPEPPQTALAGDDELGQALGAWERGTKRQRPPENHPRHRQALAARLAEGFSLADLCRALERGLPRHDWCMGRPLGRNETDDKHRQADPPNDFAIALKSAERVRELLELAGQADRQAAARKAMANPTQLPEKGEPPSADAAAALARLGLSPDKLARPAS